jgi:hypothetical protein
MIPPDDWINITREWLEEQMPAKQAAAEAAYLRFMQKLLAPFDD